MDNGPLEYVAGESVRVHATVRKFVSVYACIVSLYSDICELREARLSKTLATSLKSRSMFVIPRSQSVPSGCLFSRVVAGVAVAGVVVGRPLFQWSAIHPN